MPVQVQLDALKHMRDVQHPIATTLEHLELGMEAFHTPTRVPVKKVMRAVVEPMLSGGHKAIKATSLTHACLRHPSLELLRNHKISDATFNAVQERYGTQKTVEITTLIGHYLLVGQILLAFEVDLPEGVRPEIPA